jgi:hypothetical protein
MAWEFPLGARWLGWTALYALIYYGGVAIGETAPWGWVASLLIPIVVAFIIGVRFRSRWWTLGPLVAVTLVSAATWGTGDALPWFVILLGPILVYAGGVFLCRLRRGASRASHA